MTAAEGGAIKGGWTAALEASSAHRLSHLAARPVRAALILVALVLALDLAGNLLLPPLDRTEVIYAQTAKQMLEPDGPGTWTAPAFQGEPKFEKPLAVLWLQAATAWASGQVDQIRGYRIASILGTILAVLIAYRGAAGLLGARVAFVGAGLLATMLVITVQATLAMPEAVMLAATCAAIFALGRAYVADRRDVVGRTNALVFWIALGLGVLVNVLTIPMIAALTVLTLIVWDRGKAGWLKRLWSWPGILFFLALAALWPLVLWLGGTLDAALAQWREEGLHLALGPQEMKWRVLPGLFVVFLLLGMFPAGLFLAPALALAWRERAAPAIRFLVAWIAPYLLFLELFTRKTPLYMVQAMLPPFAVLFAMWVLRWNWDAATSPSNAEPVAIHRQRWFRLGTYGWLALVAGLVIALWVLPLLLKMPVMPLAIFLGLATLLLAVVAAKAMLSGHRLAAATSLVAMAVAFNNLTIPVTFAGLRPVWVSSEIRAAVDAIRPCLPGDVIIAGNNEPSAVFELGTGTLRVASADDTFKKWHAEKYRGVMVIGSAQWSALGKAQGASLVPASCIAAYDFIKSCSHRFVIPVPLSTEYMGRLAACRQIDRFRCENVSEKPMIGRFCK